MNPSARRPRHFPARLARRVAGVSVALATVVPTPALALDYEYDAPDECPNRDEFVAATTSRLRHPAGQNQVDRLVVSVVREHRFRANLTLIERGFEPVTRSVAADACDQAVGAIALAAALALDARFEELRSETSEPPASSAPPQIDPSPPAERESVDAPSAPPASAEAQPEPLETPEPRASPARPPSAGGVDVDDRGPTQEPTDTSDARFRVELAAGGFAGLGYSPSPAFGPSLSAALEREPFRLAAIAFYGLQSRSRTTEQRAAFAVLGGALRPCLVGDPVVSLSARICASMELSYVFTRGLTNPDGSTLDVYENRTPFVALGGLLGVGSPLPGGFHIDVDAGLGAPLVRHRFKFVNASEDLHQYPRVVPRGELWLARQF